MQKHAMYSLPDIAKMYLDSDRCTLTQTIIADSERFGKSWLLACGFFAVLRRL